MANNSCLRFGSGVTLSAALALCCCRTVSLLTEIGTIIIMDSPFSYKGKFIEGYTAITVLLPDMISKRLSRLIVAS